LPSIAGCPGNPVQPEPAPPAVIKVDPAQLPRIPEAVLDRSQEESFLERMENFLFGKPGGPTPD